jgi:hypothetical protein
MMREEYELKVYCCCVHLRKSNQHGITEECVYEGEDQRACAGRRRRCERTDILVLLEKYINNLSGTDGRPMIRQTPIIAFSLACEDRVVPNMLRRG